MPSLQFELNLFGLTIEIEIGVKISLMSELVGGVGEKKMNSSCCFTQECALD